MKNENLVKKILKGISRNSKTSFVERQIMHPDREWFFGILCGLIVLAVGVIWSVRSFSAFSNISVNNIEESKGDDLYKEAIVAEAIKQLKVREAKYEEVKKHLYNVREIKRVETSTATSTEEFLNEEAGG
jgi:hypothetical protein